jgi:hypothetical protein
VTLSVEIHASPADFDAAALTEAIARLDAIVAETSRIRLHVTSGFDDAVRRAVIDRTPGPGYTQERDFGFAVAKTITQEDGSIDVIVDAGIFSLTARPGDAARTFEHEGLHIAIDERGESVAGLRRRRGSSPTAAAAIFASMAGVSSEEYRVERVLWQGSPDVRADSHLAHFGSIARRTQETICAASFRYERDLDVPVIGRTVSDAFLALATSTAYVAAEIDATGGARDVKVDAGIYARLLGPRWRDVIEELRCLPPGDVASVGTALDVQNDRVAACLEDWLEHIGFSWGDTSEGTLSFGVLNAAEWLTA